MEEAKNAGGQFEVLKGKPEALIEDLLGRFQINAIYCSSDYEPYARKRDKAIEELCGSKGIKFVQIKDHVIFEKSEITKDDGDPYSVYTPYSKKWKEKLQQSDLAVSSAPKLKESILQGAPLEVPSLSSLGFSRSNISIPVPNMKQGQIEAYENQRDFPAKNGTTHVSVHLRFGTISIRELVQKGMELSEKWLNELIWRDFYQMILWHHPHIVDKAFRPKYDHIPWSKNELHFEAWCEGKTGYPMVDAGMRELNQTGFMHNRVRMVVASFLTKHLLLDWRWGERYFAEKLLDYELASNVGGWQWASGSGCDAAPYFRVFNPQSQLEKFDPKREYVNKWIPELNSAAYPEPIVEHKAARQNAIDTYKKALS